jgi:hypothetical protein
MVGVDMSTKAMSATFKSRPPFDRAMLLGWISILGYAALCGMIYLAR